MNHFIRLAITTGLLALALLSPRASHAQSTAQNADQQLVSAARGGKLKTVRKLLSGGASVDARSSDGATALTVAAANGRLKLVRLLLDAKADVNTRSSDGSTALSSALSQAERSRKHRKTALLLLATGAEDRGVALDFAIATGDFEIARAALAEGPLPADMVEMTAARARSAGREQIAGLLDQALQDALPETAPSRPETTPTPTRPANPAANWPSFRGPAASGRAIGDGPTEWNGETGHNVLWKAEIPGLGHSSPVIWGDRVFVTTAVPDSGEAALKVGLYGDIAPVTDDTPQSWKVMAFDKRTGEQVWEHTARHGVPEVKRHTKATHANPTPVTDGQYLVVSFGSEGIYTYDLDGHLLWQMDLGVLDSGFFRVPAAQWGFASSPVLYQGKLLLQVDVQGESFVAAFDVNDGSELWRTPREDVPTWSTPAVAPYTAGGRERQQVVVNGWKHIGGYDLETGEEVWRLVGGGDIPVPTPLYEDGLVIITSAHGPERPIYAIRTDAAGDITEQEEAFAWRQDKAGNYMQTPLIYDGLAYFCQDNGVMTVYDFETGERLHQERLGGGKSGFTGSPVAVDGKVYYTSEDGETYVLRAGPQPELIAVNELGETFMSSPAISQGVLYLRGRRHLFAIGKAAGSLADRE